LRHGSSRRKRAIANKDSFSQFGVGIIVSNPYQAPTTDSLATHEVGLSKTTIRLWNPRRLWVFGFFFGSFAGAFLHAQNWKALGNYEEAKRSYLWMWAYFAVMTIGVMSDISEVAFNVYGFVFFLFWVSTLSRQGNYIRKKQIQFTKQSWIKAIGIWCLLVLSFFVLILILAFIQVAVTELIMPTSEWP
tara:strand:- start:1247 stop:1813 length:567 start_codon:yes stop_codon:yes gene_type:complete